MINGQFCTRTVKTGKYADVEFLYDGKDFHPPAGIVQQLDKEFGSNDWDCFEIIVAERFPKDGRPHWYSVSDYGRSDYIGQYHRKELQKAEWHNTRLDDLLDDDEWLATQGVTKD